MNTKKFADTKAYLFTEKVAKPVLLLLLVVLNLVIRLPSIPHEKGYDSVFIHSLANSISIFGDAQWWVHWLSVFGFYAYSYASAVPFILSGMQQLTSFEMEFVILIYCVITGIISIFTAYILAGKILSNFIFKYGAAFFFSIAPGVMLFSTWEVSTRGLFIIMLPLFIYLLLSEIKLFKKALLLFAFIVFQFAIHHYGFVLIPILVVYLSIILLEKSKYLDRIKLHSHYAIILMIIVFIGLPFISRSLIDSGSRYSWLITSSITILRQVGPLLVLAIGGFIYVLFKKEKSSKELFLVLILTIFIPAIYSHSYGAYILLLFLVLFISIAFLNVATLTTNKKLVSIVLILALLSTVTFTAYFNHNRTGSSESYWYMGHDTYVAGMWGRNYVPDNSYGLDTAFETGRVFAISEGHPITPTISAGNLAYGFINESEIEYTKNTFLQKDFYFEGPYVAKGGTTVSGRMEWLRQAATNMVSLKDFDYFVQDTYYSKPVTFVVSQNYNKIYDNPRIVIWYYNHSLQ
jgi:hypothetical protein